MSKGLGVGAFLWFGCCCWKLELLVEPIYVLLAAGGVMFMPLTLSGIDMAGYILEH